VREGITEKDILEIRDWVNRMVSLPQDSQTVLEREGPKRFFLSIVGTGRDDRCRWCRSFRQQTELSFVSKQLCETTQISSEHNKPCNDGLFLAPENTRSTV
jgi:hypothetical protein